MSQSLAEQETTVAYANGCELRVGNIVHLNIFRGTYRITRLSNNTMTLTCNTWRYTSNPERTFPLTAFHCFYNDSPQKRYLKDDEFLVNTI